MTWAEIKEGICKPDAPGQTTDALCELVNKVEGLEMAHQYSMSVHLEEVHESLENQVETLEKQIGKLLDLAGLVDSVVQPDHKPCPKCGGKCQADRNEDRRWFVWCPSHKCVWFSHDNYDTEAEAWAAHDRQEKYSPELLQLARNVLSQSKPIGNVDAWASNLARQVIEHFGISDSDDPMLAYWSDRQETPPECEGSGVTELCDECREAEEDYWTDFYSSEKEK